MSKKTFPQNDPVLSPDWQFENDLRSDSFEWIIGIDEAGRGPLAGPVVAAAVILRSNEFTLPIADSKLLTPLQREKAFNEISAKADIGVGIIGEAAIDECNILQATFIAMNNAVLDLISHVVRREKIVPSAEKVCLLVDGNRFITDLPYPFRTIIAGDKKVFSIACASIIAKVTRDRMLDIYDTIYPQYGFRSHKGYPTAAHRKAILEHGPCAIHRKTFSVKAA